MNRPLHETLIAKVGILILAFSFHLMSSAYGIGKMLAPDMKNETSKKVENNRFSTSANIFADITVSGTVTDVTGESIPGVTVFVPGDNHRDSN